MLLALAVALAPASATAHLGNYVFPIFELAPSQVPNLTDGSLEDWDDVLPYASLTHLDFHWWGEVDPGDIAFRIFVAWTNAQQRIYLGYERADDVYASPGDGLSFAIDGDHSGGTFRFEAAEMPSEEEREQQNYRQAQVYSCAYRYASGRDELRVAGAASDWASDPPYVEYHMEQYGEDPNLYVAEAAITAWDELDGRAPDLSRPSSLEPGRIVGFSVTVYESDVPPLADGFIVEGMYTFPAGAIDPFIRRPARNGYTADAFADGELIPCALPGCSGRETAVVADAWGRIKAGLMRTGERR